MIGNKFLVLSIFIVNNLIQKSKIMNKVKISSNRNFGLVFFHCLLGCKLMAFNIWRTDQNLVGNYLCGFFNFGINELKIVNPIK